MLVRNRRPKAPVFRCCIFMGKDVLSTWPSVRVLGHLGDRRWLAGTCEHHSTRVPARSGPSCWLLITCWQRDKRTPAHLIRGKGIHFIILFQTFSKGYFVELSAVSQAADPLPCMWRRGGAAPGAARPHHTRHLQTLPVSWTERWLPSCSLSLLQPSLGPGALGLFCCLCARLNAYSANSLFEIWA